MGLCRSRETKGEKANRCLKMRSFMNSAMKWMWKKPSQLCAKGHNLEITGTPCVNTAFTSLTPQHNGASQVSQPFYILFPHPAHENPSGGNQVRKTSNHLPYVARLM